MRHIFAYLDKMAALLTYIPFSIEHETDRSKAERALRLLEEYIFIVSKLIKRNKTRTYLDRLRRCPIAEVSDWGDKVAATLKQMDALLKDLKKDLRDLKHALQHNPDVWQQTVAFMAQGMLLSGLHDDEEHLLKIRQSLSFEEEELRGLMNPQQLQRLKRWQQLPPLSKSKQYQHEVYFAQLLKP